MHKFLNDWFSEAEEINLTTSGSSGKPKTISVPKKSMVESAQRTIEFFELKPGMSALLCLPVEYIAGKMMIVRAIVGQMNLVTVEPSGLPLQSIDKVIDFAAFTPMQLYNELSIKSNPKLAFLRKVIVGGAAVNEELSSMIQKQKFEVYETYGMTETCSHIALKRLNGKHIQKSFYPLKGIKISLDNNNCIVINMENGDKICTCDIGETLSDGSFTIHGRIDNVINTGGIKISPEKIESIISSVIRDKFYISSIPHPSLGEQVVLVMEKPINEPQKLLLSLKKHLSKYEIPTLYQIDKFPLTESGKIRREELKKLLLKH